MEALPQLPVPHGQLARYISDNADKSMVEIMEPYRKFEAGLRGVFAQDRQNPALNDPYINVLPLFTEDTSCITTRARDLASETEEEKSKYIMALPDEQRRAHGSPATVGSIAEFQKNFNLFSESSLSELDWSNVVAAGSSVVNCLLPVPDAFNVNKRKLREYYHEKFCPASDVDLFLYGLTHDEAVEKIKKIEQAIRDAILTEVTVVRTKYAITIASQYPVRHVQIVLRVYKSISEILTGFDIDAAGGAYDGKQVYVTPRALGSFITQVNHVDLSRRSPSYENRLSKYSHRNFEVYWADLDRKRVDPTIFERSFQRTLGLARLLVLERLPTSSARETYQNKRRLERGRPQIHRQNFRLFGNIKGNHEDEVSDWLSEEDVSNYHTFTVPYGEKFHARRIEKLCYTRDLLLNAEWNQPKDRKVYLHRHPAFFGRVQDVIEDCCGSCPVPVTNEEKEVSEKEAEIYISGKVSFMIDDPGRQQIGSFNPLTEQDWTDMAYVGNTARLCQSIVDGDMDDVKNWLSQEGADPNQRDYTGRSPLQLAVTSSTAEIVKCLVDHGARLTARLADGKTALHLAAARGDAEIVKILMEKSISNEEEENCKQNKKECASKQSTVAKAEAESTSQESGDRDEEVEIEDEDEDGELVDATETAADVVSVVTGSFVKVKDSTNADEDHLPEESEDEPDYYQIDLLAWDIPCSPLHLAIVQGHEHIVELLCDYGADSILPVKILSDHENAAILTLVLALSLPPEKAKSMAERLLRLGAMCSQADSNGYTAFHRYLKSGKSEMVDLLLTNDKAAAKAAVNHLLMTGYSWNMSVEAPLQVAIENGDSVMALKLLEIGAKPEIDFDTWLKATNFANDGNFSSNNLEENKKQFKRNVEQPLLFAVRAANADVALRLIEGGANVNCLTATSEQLIQNTYMRSYNKGESVLDVLQHVIKKLSEPEEESSSPNKPRLLPGMDEYLAKLTPGSYLHALVSYDIKNKKKIFEAGIKYYEEESKKVEARGGAKEKQEAIDSAISELKRIEKAMIDAGAKTFAELYPDIETAKENNGSRYYAPEKEKDAVYKFDLWFQNDRTMTDSRREGYIELMEAAWQGDISKIKSLTLQPWGPDQAQPPLMADIRDNHNHAPFSFAFLRGHYATAKAILEIIQAQWTPKEVDEVRYKIEGENDDEEDYEYSDDGESDGDSENHVRIVSEKVDKKYTIDNIGEVSMEVRSHTKPAERLMAGFRVFTLENGEFQDGEVYGTLFAHVIKNDDMTGLKELLDMAQHFSEAPKAGDEERKSTFTFKDDDFILAVKSGNTQALRQIIKKTGAGVPLDNLVKKSGVAVKQKPRYYQGLTVYGKKRNDWATAGRNMVVRTSGVQTPPLLHAALGGRLECVEFFLSDVPHRLYAEYSRTKQAREDSRLKHLMDAPGGFSRAISKWLGADNELVLHCAVMANPSQEANELVEYLVETCPSSLEKKAAGGCTPLMIAYQLGRIEFAKILIAAGADQSTRNDKGENIVHAVIKPDSPVCRTRTLLNLLDSDLRKHLFQQRQSLKENGTTPLHSWILAYGSRNYNSASTKKVVAMLKLILEYSNGEELDMLNGAGDTCLHSAISLGQLAIVRCLIDFRPQLLYRESAVGRTPSELASDLLKAKVFEHRRSHRGRSSGNNSSALALKERGEAEFLLDKLAQDELLKKKAEGMQKASGLAETYTPHELARILGAMGLENPKDWDRNDLQTPDLSALVIWDLCSVAVRRHAGKRRLVSLNEANDVARRLGESDVTSRYFSVNSRHAEDDAESDNESDEGKKLSDFVHNSLQHAGEWLVQERDEKSKEAIPKCAQCGERHSDEE
ncbi:ankyrin repeat protein [Cordyceps fumosorosea ARSEF 2679]|uniref:Ankyrin repeat protein n=1 Tax=Cordyceps fumosorosea (strain ARSEF 2679) TaxID=1081104 RepID=A0A168E176_CORFA|nr:ankyrin repeat protein [Cordyceps fumosorosea ARSEF 2679]OAA73258.1 ankyrin repeat protein [Cordyceps fumosorosea ARSEF 2679]